MWSKIYLAVLGLSIAVMAFFAYYSWSWLQSVGLPTDAIEGYIYHANLSWVALWITTAVLLALGTAVLWVSDRAWAIWIASLYFLIFVIVRYFWLEQAFFQFKKTKGLSDAGISAAPLFAVMLIMLMAVVVIFDQFAVVRLRQKMYPPAIADEPAPESNRNRSSQK